MRAAVSSPGSQNPPHAAHLRARGSDSSEGGQVQEKAEQDLSARLSLEAAACLAIRRPDGACSDCAQTCPAGAIAIEARAVTLDLDACTGCGRCVTVCPTGALTLDGFLPSVATTDARVAFECVRTAPADRVERAVTVPCLGGLTPAHLHRALEAAAEVALVDRGWCVDCPAGGSAAPWDDALERVVGDLTLVGARPDRVRLIHHPLAPRRALPPPQPRRPADASLSRRQLLARLATPAAAPDRRRVAAPHPGSGKVRTPALASRLERLRKHAAGTEIPGAAFPALDAVGPIDARLAAGLCPTDALHLHEDTDADRLELDAAFCLGCGECLPAGGLDLRERGDAPYAGPRTLTEQAMADCPRCLRRHAPRAGQRICDACATDHELAALGHGLMRRTQVPYGA